MKIPIAKPIFGKEEKEAVCKVLDSGMIAQGERVLEFEKLFSSYCGAKHSNCVKK
ncbi:MAG: DegT/DnrJ/EryC1/StrS family aminotransferase [Nanoarchaeota archaeon]|nr:DegT/DnrJ/EryC1/StrS family aminotransferase [Nanoarchaeota archaeon]MBU1269686.1 DegT/DnrJ/EryC1/StrS family aminotransferase [Nanoarchaeota archaeon]MBU1605132.1 DegT/DnrJ/EryC1/StrS family aminotransferase [Nanoarchaeota archaeon]MBU2442915.1 DegT/DnrJ/EryC1/StrS family aminotransferase [Nanoarchaeota archaeon]